MFANLPAKKDAKDSRNKMVRTQKKVDKNGVSEKNLTVEQRALFQQAKQRELRSFFENEVWQFDSVQNADAARTLTARMLLKWSKNEDGSPRAKARLIVRGYADVDALQGSLETSSPTIVKELSAIPFDYVWLAAVDFGHLHSISPRTTTRKKVVGQTSCRMSSTTWSLRGDKDAVGQAGVWSVGCST